MVSRISGGSPLKILSKTLNGSPYHMFVVHTPFADYEDTFNKNQQDKFYTLSDSEFENNYADINGGLALGSFPYRSELLR